MNTRSHNPTKIQENQLKWKERNSFPLITVVSNMAWEGKHPIQGHSLVWPTSTTLVLPETPLPGETASASPGGSSWEGVCTSTHQERMTWGHSTCTCSNANISLVIQEHENRIWGKDLPVTAPVPFPSLAPFSPPAMSPQRGRLIALSSRRGSSLTCPIIITLSWSAVPPLPAFPVPGILKKKTYDFW